MFSFLFEQSENEDKYTEQLFGTVFSEGKGQTACAKIVLQCSLNTHSKDIDSQELTCKRSQWEV